MRVNFILCFLFITKLSITTDQWNNETVDIRIRDIKKVRNLVEKIDCFL